MEELAEFERKACRLEGGLEESSFILIQVLMIASMFRFIFFACFFMRFKLGIYSNMPRVVE